jgi:hypothetical protein
VDSGEYRGLPSHAIAASAALGAVIPNPSGWGHSLAHQPQHPQPAQKTLCFSAAVLGTRGNKPLSGLHCVSGEAEHYLAKLRVEALLVRWYSLWVFLECFIYSLFC